jgi:hypothetical protein
MIFLSNHTRQQVDDVTHHTNGNSLTFLFRFERAVDALVNIVRHHINVTGVETLLYAPLFHIRRKANTLIHCDGQRLSATHTSETARDRKCFAQCTAEMLAGNLSKGFIRALNDSLRSDVDPGALQSFVRTW